MESKKPDNNFLKEWEISREVIKTFDDRLHDVRKYGFSFITAFLTGSTILFTTYLVEPSTNVTEGVLFPESIKAIILGVTLFLILGLNILYRNYIKAAASRANVLERILNIELTAIITQRHRENRINKFVTALYIIFIFGVVLLGTAVLWQTPIFLIILYLDALATSVVIMVFTSDDLLMQYRYGKIDWMLDKTECKQGDEVKLIMSNISNSLFPNPKYPIKKEEVMWKMVKQCENPNFGNDNKLNVVLGTMEADFSGT
jgi:hypothetical protein